MNKETFGNVFDKNTSMGVTFDKNTSMGKLTSDEASGEPENSGTTEDPSDSASSDDEGHGTGS